MEKMETSGEFEVKDVRRNKNSPKDWKNLFRIQVLSKANNLEERLKKEMEWKNNFSRLEEKITKRALELKREQNDKKSFQDDNFFLNKVWSEFTEVALEDIEDIINADYELDSQQEELSNEEKEEIRAARIEEKNNTVNALRQLMPNFFTYNQTKQRDVLDNMYKDIENDSKYLFSYIK